MDSCFAFSVQVSFFGVGIVGHGFFCAWIIVYGLGLAMVSISISVILAMGCAEQFLDLLMSILGKCLVYKSILRVSRISA